MARIFDSVKNIFTNHGKLNNLVFIVFDSCRYDAYMAAKTPNLDRIGKAEKRYSYASWTSPSHYTFLMGMVPHLSPKGVFASNVYRDEFALWSKRLNICRLKSRRWPNVSSWPRTCAASRRSRCPTCWA